MTLSQRGCLAHALALPEGLVVLAGSQMATSSSVSLERTREQKRTQLQKSGGVTLQDDRFILTHHLFFHTPSAAGSVITGTPVNGHKVWRDPGGRSWDDLEWGD